MSFIYCYYFAQTYSAEPPSQWQSSDIQRFEKMLKLETSFRGVQLQRNSKEQFLAALKEKSELLRFLDGFPEFAQLFQSKTDLLKDYPECTYEGFSFTQLATEVEQFLSDDWIVFLVEELDQNRFYYLKFMLRFKAILPERVAQTLKNKLEARILQFDADLEIADSKVDWSLFKNYTDFIQLLNDKKLAQLIFSIENKRRRLLNQTIEIINKPGIIHFFETMFGGVYYLFHHPEDAEGIRERQRVMGDFKFMGSILLGIIILFIIGAYYGQHRKAERKQQIEAAKVGYYPSFFYYPENKITLDSKVLDTVKTGFDFYQMKYTTPDSSGLTFINATPFEVILFSDEQAVDAFFKEPQKRKEALQYLYIQPKDTLRFSTHGMPFHLYVGKQLSNVQAAKSNTANFPRFQQPFQGAEKYLPNPIEIQGGFMELKGTNYELYLHADRSFFVNGQSKVGDTVFSLFKN
ncbi:MAG: hypothetical protein ACOVP9_02695 [Flavobacterium stagni]